MALAGLGGRAQHTVLIASLAVQNANYENALKKMSLCQHIHVHLNSTGIAYHCFYFFPEIATTCASELRQLQT